MKKLTYFFLLTMLPLVVAMSKHHEYYVSVTEVNYVEEEQTLQIISQIFIDDFEKALQTRYDSDLVLAGINESEKVDALMERYLKSKLKIWVNDEEVNYTFLGKEYKEDITYCYIEIVGIPDIKSIGMRNEILLDVFESQQNISRFSILDKNKSFLMVRDNTDCMLNFD